ncbi:U-box domain-containing protein 62-like [Magnolia sinica]|uniref:U-box domain-containing protein 62-like n=1 Tax=Magnolia sinica TaxID=86752 RepID=UPI002658C126|nr:U-box domain-containing protein 62-like [Magnolia sinica]
MVSEEMDLVPPLQRIENGLNPQMVFQDGSLHYSCGAPQRRAGDPVRKPRFIDNDDKLFAVDRERFFRMHGTELRRSIYESPCRPRDQPENPDWNGDGSAGTPSGDGSDEEEEDDDEDEQEEDDEGDGEVDGLVAVEDGGKNNNSSGSVQSSSEKIRTEKTILQKHQHASFGSHRALVKDSSAVHSQNNIRGSLSEHQHQLGRMIHYENAITIAEPDIYHAQMMQGPEASALAQKEIGGEYGCGFSGRKDFPLSIESGESLRAILSDPITGSLMDDAMILSCGHSFGSGGLQHVLRMKACYACTQSLSEDAVAPNLALRSAVQAFRREEELQFSRASKRRRDRFEQDKCSYGDQFPMEFSRGKGVQFPFAVTDRVIIKGNKRTPLRFVGREAVVTTQCLNGWYVVKTLDNAESVKLQYRSLAKVPGNPPSNTTSCKSATPNWL